MAGLQRPGADDRDAGVRGDGRLWPWTSRRQDHSRAPVEHRRLARLRPDQLRRGHPTSALASLVARGTVYTQAYSTAPSDSFPATLAITTGGSPSSTGVYYDATWDDNLSPPGSNCSTRGTAVAYKENINFTATSASASDINPATLPRDPDNGCSPVYPH